MKVNISSPLIKNKDVAAYLNMPLTIHVIGNFEEDTAKKVYEDCDKALATGQDILPIFIDSYGGSVYSLLGIIDYFDGCRKDGVKIVTIACGKAMSAGAILFCLGDDRYIGKRSTVMFHRVSGFAIGNADEALSSAKETEVLERMILGEASMSIGKKKDYLFSELKDRNFSDWYLRSKECLDLGIATHEGIPQFQLTVSTEFHYD